MIEGYVGLIGGGKSYNATLRMLEYMASGGVVYTNMTLIRQPWYNLRYASKMKEFKLSSIPWAGGSVVRKVAGVEYYFTADHLCICRIAENGDCFANSIGFERYLLDRFKWRFQDGQYNKVSNDDVTGDLHGLIPRGTPDKPVLCVLDESVDFFDTDDRAKANREFLSFLRHSRKQCVDMIFIAQEFTELNKRIRNQTHFIWTFWDMQTFKIPGLRSTLPPPWRNMILSQQWNKSMTGGPLKRIWRSRDVGIFGCYRTDELFRELKSGQGETDFRGRGDLKNGGKKMNKFERVALFLCVIFSALSFFEGANPDSEKVVVTESISVKESEQTAEKSSAIVVRYGQFQYWEGTDFESGLVVDGVRIRVGDMTPDGTVLAANSEHVHIRSVDNIDTFIYPFFENKQPLVDRTSVAQVNQKPSQKPQNIYGQ